MTTKMLEFMEMYDRPNHATRGNFKLSHFEVGKLLKCAIDTDKYGNIYYRHLTTYIRDNLFLGKDYIIEPKVKKQPGQRTWLLTKDALYVIAMALRGSKPYRLELVCDQRLQREHGKYIGLRFAQPTRAIQ